jgi:carbon monoxide dehydrogenase subunit G
VTRFSTRIESSDVVGAPPEAIFGVLQDPQLLSDLTPLVESITAIDDLPRWRWQLTGISALGTRFHPCFTVAMHFAEHDRIDFHHDPPAGANEHAAAEGIYELTPVDDDPDFPDGATRVAIQLDVHVELPLPKVSRRAVEGVMHRTMERMGDRFAVNLRRHLGVRR